MPFLMLPSHIAIIMDGNGRWAKARNLPRTAGHKAGIEAVKNSLQACKDLNIKHLTLYAFSSENWKRPLTEIEDLMGLLRFYLSRETHNLHENNIRVRIIGDRLRLSDDIKKSIEYCENLTQHNTALHLNIALSYGSRQEIVETTRTIAREILAGKYTPEALTEEIFAAHLYTSSSPDPDLLIRTGGEQRLSNFLLWQSAYTELFFTPVLWPDFTEKHLQDAVDSFKGRERRWGKI